MGTSLIYVTLFLTVLSLNFIVCFEHFLFSRLLAYPHNIYFLEAEDLKCLALWSKCLSFNLCVMVFIWKIMDNDSSCGCNLLLKLWV